MNPFYLKSFFIVFLFLISFISSPSLQAAKPMEEDGPVSPTSSGKGHSVEVEAKEKEITFTECTIRTIAGNTARYATLEAEFATQIRLNKPFGIAIDNQDNLFIADSKNHMIRKVDVNNRVFTVAGTGRPGFTGDGNWASLARLNNPLAVAVNSQGDVFIADTDNNRVRKVSGGRINTTLGNRIGYGNQTYLSGPWGLALDDQDNLFISHMYTQIYKVSPTNITTFLNDHAIARNLTVSSVYPGYVFYTQMPPSGEEIIKGMSTAMRDIVAGVHNSPGFSGDGGPALQAQLDGASGLAIDDQGNLYVADTNNHRIRRVDTFGVISTVAGNGVKGFSGDNGPSTQAQLDSPQDVAIDSQGNLYVADTGNNKIRKVTCRLVSK